MLGFRNRGSLEQLAWSIALSFGVGTLPIVASAWIFGIGVTGYILLALALFAMIVFSRTRPELSLNRPLIALGIAFALFVLLSLTDVGLGHHLWMSVTTYDQGIRTAFIDAVLHTGVPPANPLYWPGHAAPMRYYYFWYVTCAVIAKLAHISARQVLIASCVWPFAGVLSMLALYASHLLGWQRQRLRRGWWLAVALLSVTGLDLLATIGARLGGDPLYADMDWWSIDQVPSWADSFLWVPHHVAALICCLLMLLLVSLASSREVESKRMQLSVLAGLSFAGAFGLSTYVALSSAIVVAMWLLWRLFCENWREVLASVAVTSLSGALLLMPYMLQLVHHGAGEGAARNVITPAVREIISPGAVTNLAFIKGFSSSHPFAAKQLAALVLLVPGYIAELGFFLLALLTTQWQMRQRNAGESALLFWTWSGLAAATFVRSQVIATNDYGIRAMLVPQFFLILTGVLALEQSSGWMRKILIVLAAIGVAGSMYQVTMLRVYLPWHEAQDNKTHAGPNLELSQRNYALRDAYDRLDETIPTSARVQYEPEGDGYLEYSHLLNIHRQVIVDGKTCNASFGGDRSACAAIQTTLAQIYAEVGPSATTVPNLCNQIGAQYLVASRWNSVWNVGASWVWTLPVAAERPDVRILKCAFVEKP